MSDMTKEEKAKVFREQTSKLLDPAEAKAVKVALAMFMKSKDPSKLVETLKKHLDAPEKHVLFDTIGLFIPSKFQASYKSLIGGGEEPVAPAAAPPSIPKAGPPAPPRRTTPLRTDIEDNRAAAQQKKEEEEKAAAEAEAARAAAEAEASRMAAEAAEQQRLREEEQARAAAAAEAEAARAAAEAEASHMAAEAAEQQRLREEEEARAAAEAAAAAAAAEAEAETRRQAETERQAAEQARTKAEEAERLAADEAQRVAAAAAAAEEAERKAAAEEAQRVAAAESAQAAAVETTPAPQEAAVPTNAESTPPPDAAPIDDEEEKRKALQARREARAKRRRELEDKARREEAEEKAREAATVRGRTGTVMGTRGGVSALKARMARLSMSHAEPELSTKHIAESDDGAIVHRRSKESIGRKGLVSQYRQSHYERIDAANREKTLKEKLEEAEAEAGAKFHGKIVIYTTTVSVMLKTKMACSEMRKIFQRLRVPFEERNVYMSTAFAAELEARLPKENVPQAFFNGKYLGNSETILRMNETGELQELTKHMEKKKVMEDGDCEYCGGQGFIMCTECGGDKKSVQLQYGSARAGLQHALKCTACNENGLMVCRMCISTTTA